jgi:hypothetical protein
LVFNTCCSITTVKKVLECRPKEMLIGSNTSIEMSLTRQPIVLYYLTRLQEIVMPVAIAKVMALHDELKNPMHVYIIGIYLV